MSEFGPDATEMGSVAAFNTVKQPIPQQPYGLLGAANLFADAGGLLSFALDKREEKKNAGVLQNFTNKQLAIIQGIDQGKFSSQFGRTQMRSNIIQMINDYPLLREDILRANSALLGTGGMGGFVITGTEDENRKRALHDRFVASGMIDPDASQQEFEVLETEFISTTQAAAAYESQMQELRTRKAQVDLQSAEYGLLEKQEKKATQDYLLKRAPMDMKYLNAQTDKLMQQVRDGEIDPAAAVATIEQEYATFLEETSQFTPLVSDTFRSAMLKPFEERKNLAIQLINGELEANVYKSKLDAIINKQKLLITNSTPEMLTAVGISELFGDKIPYDQIPEITNQLSRIISDGMNEVINPVANSPENKRAFELFYKVLSEDVDLSPAQKQERSKMLTSVFTGVEDYEGFIRKNPEGIIPTIEWMASDSFNKLKAAHPEAFEKQGVAREIISQHYVTEVIDMFRSDFSKANVAIVQEVEGGVPGSRGGGGNRKSVTTPVIDGVQVRINESGNIEFFTNSSEKAFIETARELNKDYAPVFNMNAKAIANLNGIPHATQAKAMLDQIMSNETGQISSNEGSDLDLDDFDDPEIDGASLQDLLDSIPDPQILEGVPEELAARVPTPSNWESIKRGIFAGESGGDYDALFGFSNRPGRVWDHVKITDMTVDQAISFSSVDGPYGKWVKEKLRQSGKRARIATPMGAYQIVGNTLRMIKKDLRLTGKERMTPALQDLMGKYLLKVQGTGAWEGYRGPA